MCAVAVRRESAGEIESGPAAGDEIEHAGRDDRADDLRRDVRRHETALESTAGPQSDGHRRVEMRTGNRSECVGAGQHREPERQRDSSEADAEIGKGRGEYGGAASPKHEPEGSKELADECWIHVISPSSEFVWR